ncbi:MAG: hypothetical protein FWB80_09215 [Defluviitaleaceae bacterium]|nr:hypothetical protein [Defluviitaleaceae bacterium]
MCCLFGLLDYKGVFSSKDKNIILSVLSAECEARGIDATGIAYNTYGRLCLYKRPLPAHKLNIHVPDTARFIMGHTRMTTQGSEKRNINNHPFKGGVKSTNFALAHNGILNNDIYLRKKESLPHTKIQTDSYVAVQLLEKQNALNFKSLKYMAEKVEGIFTFTVLDDRDNLYVVRGGNPFALYHFSEWGFYLYASTDEILTKALSMLGIRDLQRESILLSYGDILKINRNGKMHRGYFDGDSFNDYLPFRENCNSYTKALKSVAFYYGYLPDDIDNLLADGFSCEEIESLMCV